MPTKTKLTTVRIPVDLYDVVQRDAKEEGIGFNTILTQLLRKYVEWDRPARKFGLISMPHEAFVQILELIKAEDFDGLGVKLSRIMAEASELWFNSTDYDSKVNLLDAFSRYGGLGVVQTEDSELHKTIHLRHQLGSAGTHLLSAILERALLGENIEPRIERRGENSITIKSKKIQRQRKRNSGNS